jgi:hypothetical protein
VSLAFKLQHTDKTFNIIELNVKQGRELFLPECKVTTYNM